MYDDTRDLGTHALKSCTHIGYTDTSTKHYAFNPAGIPHHNAECPDPVGVPGVMQIKNRCAVCTPYRGNELSWRAHRCTRISARMQRTWRYKPTTT